MSDPYSTLGIPKSSSTDEARAAYRKLASKYHPDKVVDEAQKKIVEEKFKVVKEAFESIEAGWQPEPVRPPPQYARSSSFTKPEPAFEGYAPAWEKANAEGQATARAYKWNGFGTKPSSQAYKTAAPKITPYTPRIVEAYRPPDVRKNVGDFIAHVSISEAFNGYLCDVSVEGKKYRVKVPPGVPHGLRFTVPIEGKNDVTVITRFMQSAYTYKGVNEALLEGTMVNGQPAQVYRTKDLWIRHEINQKHLRFGTSVEMIDVAGQKFSVRIPAGHDPREKIKVEGRGYYDWYTTFSRAGSVRGDLYVQLIPTEEVPMSHLL